MFWKRKKADRLADKLNPDLRRLVKILVIDDDPNSFPIEILRNEGYNLEYWPEVKELSKLENGYYDIIVLDIQGVAQRYNREDGLGILQHIKTRNPAQIVVAFSGQTYDLSKNKFWKMADECLAKPIDATKAKATIDDLLDAERIVKHYWGVVVQLLRNDGVDDRGIEKLEHEIVDLVEKKQTAQLAPRLSKILTNTETAVKIVSICMKLVSLFPT